MGAVHVAVIGKEDDVCVFGKAELVESSADATEIPIKILDHAVIAGEICSHTFLEFRIGRNIGTQLEFVGRVAARPFLGWIVGLVRWLDGEDVEKGLVASSVVAQSLDKEVGEGVGFIAGHLAMKGGVTFAAVNPTVVLGEVVLVGAPVTESPASLGWDDVAVDRGVAFVQSVKVPFAEVGGVVAVIVEGRGDGGQGRVEGALVSGDGVVWIASADEGTAEGAAEGRAGDCLLKENTFAGELIEMRGANVGVATKAEGLGAMLIAKDPDEVGRGGAAHFRHFDERRERASTFRVFTTESRSAQRVEPRMRLWRTRHTKGTKTEKMKREEDYPRNTLNTRKVSERMR